MLSCLESNQRHMPRPKTIVNALPAVAHECTQVLSFDAFAGRGDNNQHTTRAERNERLTAERMPLDHIKPIRQRCRCAAARDTDRNVTAICNVDSAKIVESFKTVRIHCVGLLCRSADNIAVRCESFAR